MSTMHSPITPAPDAQVCAHADAFGILLACHEHIGERLAILEQTGRDLADADALTEHHLARLCDVLAFLDTAIPIHSADEELTLFPRLRALPTFRRATGGTPMDCMEAEHVEHAAAKAALKAAIVKRDVMGVARRALALVAGYREHIAKEEQVLFPMARDLLDDPAVVDEMTHEMRARRRAAGLLGC